MDMLPGYHSLDRKAWGLGMVSVTQARGEVGREHAVGMSFRQLAVCAGTGVSSSITTAALLDRCSSGLSNIKLPLKFTH
jgi:hypothetical protein